MESHFCEIWRYIYIISSYKTFEILPNKTKDFSHIINIYTKKSDNRHVINILRVSGSKLKPDDLLIKC